MFSASVPVHVKVILHWSLMGMLWSVVLGTFEYFDKEIPDGQNVPTIG